MSIILTEKAIKEIKRIMEEQEFNEDNICLRIGAKGGGCSGYEYTMDLTDVKDENDKEFDCDGIKVVCDPKSYLYIDGTELDFKDELMGRGFLFKNDNHSCCGCGQSFCPSKE